MLGRELLATHVLTFKAKLMHAPQKAFVRLRAPGGSFLHLVKVNHEVNRGILACDWPIA